MFMTVFLAMFAGLYKGETSNNCTVSVASESRTLLMNVTNYLIEDFNSSLNEDVLNETVMTIFSCLTSLGTLLLSPTSEGMAFSDLMSVLVNLAEEESGLGHVQLFKVIFTYFRTH